MIYTKILKVIDEGLLKSLIDFGNSKILKSERITEALYKFELGDYVYKDKKLGYNNTYGDKVAICVNDDPDNMMYMVLDHPSYNETYRWAKDHTGLYTNMVPQFQNGYEVTKWIFENTDIKDLINTIWNILDSVKGNIIEYIPTINELEIIYKNREYNENLKKILKNGIYWSSSQYDNNIGSTILSPTLDQLVYIMGISDNTHYASYCNKSLSMIGSVIVLLKID